MDEGPQKGRREWDQRCKWREQGEHLPPPLRQKGKERGNRNILNWKSKEFEGFHKSNIF